MTPAPRSDTTLGAHLTFTHGLDEAQVQTLNQALVAIDGLVESRLDRKRRRLHVRYDVTRTGLEPILRRLQAIGLPPSRGLGQRLRQGWALYREQNARTNARAPAPACCNQPPRPRK